MAFLVNYPSRRQNQVRHASYHESYPAVNIAEKEEGWTLGLAVPGLKKEDFQVEVKDNKLTISYEESSEKEGTKEAFTRKEFGFRSFKRSFWLPETVDASKIAASYNQGILSIEVPKKEEEKPEVFSVEIA